MKTALLRIRESIVRVTAERESFIGIAEAAIRRARLDLGNYICKHQAFRYALTPMPCDPKAPPLVRHMIAAAERAGVGPMAAVAGAIAEAALTAMIEAGATHTIVENGGDVAMILERPVTVGIFTGRKLHPDGSPARGSKSHVSMRTARPDFGLRIPPRPGPIGICTSSGTVGHSLSFGIVDAVTVVAGDAALADAAATALANRIASPSPGLITRALEEGWVDGIEGALAICGDHIGTIGDLPEIVILEPRAVNRVLGMESRVADPNAAECNSPEAKRAGGRTPGGFGTLFTRAAGPTDRCRIQGSPRAGWRLDLRNTNLAGPFSDPRISVLKRSTLSMVFNRRVTGGAS